MASEGSKPVRIGLLGRGTVGAAFAELLAERAEAVEAATGRRPEISGALTRGEGDFDSILAGSDLIVELMGGTDPAREHVLAALRAGKPVGTANKQPLAQHGDEILAVAPGAGGGGAAGRQARRHRQQAAARPARRRALRGGARGGGAAALRGGGGGGDP